MPPADDYDLVIVGAGVVGLATALALLEQRPDLRLAILDKEDGVAAHQSGHNSGVLHSGLYYEPGSLKAQLCVEGRTLLENYAERQGIAFDRCGKLVVAIEAAELPRLAELQRRGEANGLRGLRQLSGDELKEVEPAATGLAALHVRETAVIDFAEVAHAYARDATTRGAAFLLGHRLLRLDQRAGGWRLATSAGDLRGRRVITCAGLYADRCAQLAGQRSDVRIVPFRGDYYTLSPRAAGLVRALIYPVPDPALPFLGVHFTRRIDGAVWAGPNAVLALAREGYRRRNVRLDELWQSLRFPGLWRMLARHWRAGIHEAWRDAVKRAYVHQLRRYVPEISGDELTFGPSGVRAQAVRRDGALVTDFILAEGPDVLHVLNAPSPAATASLAIGRRLAARAIERFDL